MRVRSLFVPILFPIGAWAQAYSTWLTGSAVDLATDPQGGVCLMGGATEHDNAMRWFLQRANGGDVLVLRASGEDGYNDYLFSELGVAVNSVLTIRFNEASAAQDPYIHERIRKAEAIWFAGGDQWNYVSYWRDTPIDSLVNLAVAERHIVIGGTSAGMAILGGVYFSAEHGSVTSGQALAAPYSTNMTVSHEPFLEVPWLTEVITDTHYDNPDRRARHMTFMARAITDHEVDVLGIACNEYVAVCVDTAGMAHVFGEWPDYEEYAYFIQANCATTGVPEVCTAGQPLTWYHEGVAVKAYQVPGTMQGVNTFDLADRHTGTGGTWQDWWVIDGAFNVSTGEPMPECPVGIRVDASAQSSLQALGDGVYLIPGEHAPQGVHVTDALGREWRLNTAPHVDGLCFRIPSAIHGLCVVRLDRPARTLVWKLIVS